VGWGGERRNYPGIYEGRRSPIIFVTKVEEPHHLHPGEKKRLPSEGGKKKKHHADTPGGKRKKKKRGVLSEGGLSSIWGRKEKKEIRPFSCASHMRPQSFCREEDVILTRDGGKGRSPCSSQTKLQRISWKKKGKKNARKRKRGTVLLCDIYGENREKI